MTTTIYTCVNKKYQYFIPLFCAANLWCCPEDVSICIGISDKLLDEHIKKSIDILNEKYGNKITIMGNVFKEHGSNGIVGNKTVRPNTVRFITEPSIKSDYVYISDVDIISMVPDYFVGLIKDMKDNNRHYSNIVRRNYSVKSMSGLHFSEWNAYYPIDTSNVDNWAASDEHILWRIVSKRNEIDYNTAYRPVFGIHMSPSRPNVQGGTIPRTSFFRRITKLYSGRLNAQGGTIPGWGATPYKESWEKFKETDYYKLIEPYFGNEIKIMINKLEDYYNNSSLNLQTKL